MKRRVLQVILLIPVLAGVILAPVNIAFASSYTFGDDKIDIKDGSQGANGFMYLDEWIQNGNSYFVEAFPGSPLPSGSYQDISARYTGSLEFFYRVGVPESSLSTPYFLNGTAIFQIAFNPVNTGATVTVGKADLIISPVINDNICIFAFNDSSNSNLIKFYVYFRNYCVTDVNNLIPIPEISYSYNMIIHNYLDVEDTSPPLPDKIQVVTGVTSYNAVFGRTPAPDINIGDGAIIHDAVLSAINGSSLSDYSALLNAIYQQDSSVYADVLSYLADLSSDSENIKLYLMANLPDILSNIENISSEQLRFNNAMYQLIYDYLYGAPSDTEAQSAMAEQSQALASVGDALNVSKPNKDAIVNAPDLLIDTDVENAQTSLFAWTNNTYILPCLLITMTLALLSFVLYGKSG